MKNFLNIILVLVLCLFNSCKTEQKRSTPEPLGAGKAVEINYASGLSIMDFGSYKIITVENPWPDADRSYKYLLVQEDAVVPDHVEYDQRVRIPVERVVVTSTTHIPSLEILGVEAALVGFPGLEYISSEKTRSLIAQGKVRELGRNEALNTESLLDLNPDVVIGFSIDGSNKSFNTAQKSGIPIVYNSDWTESSPLGKAEWVKFFGAFFGKTEAAENFFKQIESEYLKARELAKQAETQPTVMAGAMYKDQWYLPAGDSWQAHFIEDANARYLYAQSEGTGSLSLSFEGVLARSAQAEVWVGPAQFTSYEELISASPHYGQFAAFQNRNIYTFSSVKGASGGVVFYELAPNRPDLVLKDLISIFHPDLLPDHQTTFYKPLE